MSEAVEESPIGVRRRRAGPWLAALIPFAAVVVWVYGFTPRAPFSGDAGTKLIQAQSLWDAGYAARSVSYDYALDPDGTYFPLGEAFVRRDSGKHKVVYSVVIASLAAPTVGLAGEDGVPIVPLLGTLLLALALMRVLRRYESPVWVIGLVEIAALVFTPVLLYSFELSAHTLAAGLVTLAFSFLIDPESRRGALWAGALAAGAATVRPEGYLALAALGLGVAAMPATGLHMWLRRCLLYAAGAVPVVLAYWAINYVSTGAVVPTIASATRLEPDVWKSVTTQLITELPHAKLWTWMIPFVVVIGVGLVPRRWLGDRYRWIAVTGAAVVVSVFVYRAQELSEARTLSGLLAVTPLVLLGLARGPLAADTRAAWVASIVFIALVVLLEPTGLAGGLQLGSRYLVLVVPMLMVLAARLIVEVAREARPLARAAVAVAVLIVFALQARGMYSARGLPKTMEITRKGAAVIALAKASPSQVVVTRRYWESRVLAQLVLAGKRLYTVQGDIGAALVERLAARGVSRFLYTGGETLAIPLQDGRWARTQSLDKGWIYLQEVRIE